MDTLNDLVQRDRDDFERIKHLRRKRKRNEREEQKKIDNHWCFVAGTIVAKYLRGSLDIHVHKGKDAAVKNAEAFAPLEQVMRSLAADPELLTRLMALPGPPTSDGN